jgi:hypothetical protein
MIYTRRAFGLIFLVLAFVFCDIALPRANAQQSVTNVTTISKIFYTWDYLGSGGASRNCGYVLTGEWYPPHPEYNQASLYTLYVKDTQGRDRSLSWWETVSEPGVPFKFDIGGSWASGPAWAVTDCKTGYDTSGMVEWTATLIVRPPNVNFSFREDPQIPGRVHFTSLSSDPLRKAMEYQWSFGDGAGDTFVNPTHDYTKPGTNEVVLRVSNPIGAFAFKTNKVVIKAPTLDVSVGYVERPQTNPKLGETFKVRVRVAATQGFGPLTNVRFDSAEALGTKGEGGIHLDVEGGESRAVQHCDGTCGGSRYGGQTCE